MGNIGENIKLVKVDEEVLLKLYNKKSAIYFSIFLTARGIDFRFISAYEEDDLFYDDDDKGYEYLFWIKKDDWNDLKDDISWEVD